MHKCYYNFKHKSSYIIIKIVSFKKFYDSFLKFTVNQFLQILKKKKFQEKI